MAAADLVLCLALRWRRRIRGLPPRTAPRGRRAQRRKFPHNGVAWLGASFAKVQEHWADEEYEKPSDQAVKNASGWQFIKLIKNPAEGGSTDALSSSGPGRPCAKSISRLYYVERVGS